MPPDPLDDTAPTLLARLQAALSPPDAARVGSVRRTARGLLVVAEAGGLDEAERGRLEETLRKAGAAILPEGGAGPQAGAVQVALTASRARRRLLAVASGKGGVGKSTLTANLAHALARAGHKVGVVDADIYGPSQPTLLGTGTAKPEARGKQLVPVIGAAGIPVLSMGHLVAPGRALAWRGPMAGNALAQLIEADWGETELLLIDMPPGTGDVALTVIQRFRPDGAVLVSTPQDLALIDAARAGQLFDTAGVPVIGLVENMAGYACPHCGEWSDPFGRGGVEAAAGRLELPFLGRVPLSAPIRAASDAGTPLLSGGSGESAAGAAAFAAIAQEVERWLAQGG